jgi:hypothetical protein
MMSLVVNCDGGVPDGAPTCGTSPAFAETVGSDPSADDAADDGVDESDEFIWSAPKDARATRDSAKIEAIMMRGFFMGCTLSFTFAPPVIDSRY